MTFLDQYQNKSEHNKVMFQSSWTNNVALEFIELYKRERILWDPCDPEHKNRGELNDAWVRIQSKFSQPCSINDLKKKKESLMTSFRLHLNKKKRSGGSYQSTWYAFSLMESFLGAKYECETSPNQFKQEYFTNDDAAYDTTTSDHTTYTHTQKTKKSSSGKGSSSKSKTTYKPKIKRENIYLNESNGIVDEKFVDEYDLFGQLLATKLRKLDESQRDIAMHEIDKIMFRTKMQNGDKLSLLGSRKPVFPVTQSDHVEFENEGNIAFEEEEILEA